jgi:hypothetical protein
MTDPTCAACGHPRSNHPYRHRFVGPSLEDDVKDLEAKLAKAVGLALEECPFRWGTPSYDNFWRDRRAALAELTGGKDD